MRIHHPRLTRHLASVLLCTLLVTACGKPEDNKAATQAAARVDGREISIHQINAVLQRYPDLGVEQLEAAKQQTLDKLIDQQLAIRQAEALKLDRTPDVLTALESARRNVIAKAYLQHLAAGLPPLESAEIRKYYDAHPELFSQRAVYALQEISLPLGALPAEERQALAKTHSMDAIAKQLQEKNLAFKAGNLIRPAEQLPMEILPPLATAKNGQILILDTAQNTLILRLVETRSNPLNFEQATPAIKAYLDNQRLQTAIGSDMQRLRTAAKIEYLGEFAHKDKATLTPQPPSPPGQPAWETEPPAHEEPATTSHELSESALKKGLSGMK